MLVAPYLQAFNMLFCGNTVDFNSRIVSVNMVFPGNFNEEICSVWRILLCSEFISSHKEPCKLCLTGYIFIAIHLVISHFHLCLPSKTRINDSSCETADEACSCSLLYFHSCQSRGMKFTLILLWFLSHCFCLDCCLWLHFRYLGCLEAKEQQSIFCLSFCFEHTGKGRGPGLLEK